MCGILGGIGPGVDGIDEAAARVALAAIEHRGPDAEGLWRAPGMLLGHRRLSIIDLDSRAHQPMHRGPLSITYNGEVYNYRELRRSLENRGHSFKTSSDTEVLLAGCHEYGMSFLEQVEGMFSFGLWDERDHSLSLARDRFGEKPMFVLRESNRILFASELAALEKLAAKPLEEDPKAIGLYFRFSYVPAPLSPFANVSQLEPGTWMRIEPDLTSRINRYYAVPCDAAAPIAYQEAVGALRERLTRAVEERLSASDVPVATLLSGGIDSSVITILANRTYGRPVRAYTLAFPDDPGFDESGYARAVTARLPSVRHEVISAGVDDLLAFTDRLFSHVSEPLADASLVPSAYLLSKVEEKVVLGGDGADEVFAGYGVYPSMTLSARLPAAIKRVLRAQTPSRNPARIGNPLLRAVALFHANLDVDPVAEYLSWRTYARPATLAPLEIDLSGDALIMSQLADAGSGGLRDIQAVDIAFNLPNDMLRKVDIASMMFGIEVRLPYLDTQLVRFALGLPDRFRMTWRSRKRILRDAFANELPPEILTRRKMGFLMPIRSWFRAGPLRSHLEHLVATQNRFDPAHIRRTMVEHASGEIDHSVLLWSLMVYLQWRNHRSERFRRAA